MPAHLTRLTRDNLPEPIQARSDQKCKVIDCPNMTPTGVCADCAYRITEENEALQISLADLQWLHDNSDESHNPHWLAYCRANGNTPDEQLGHDRKKWPGGCMVGYILWINDRHAEFRQAHPEAFIGQNIGNRKLWGEFLQQYADAQPAPEKP